MNEYRPCHHCGSRIINKFQHYDMCGCQVQGGLDNLTHSEREMIKEFFPTAASLKGAYDFTPKGREERWLREAERYFDKGLPAEAEAVLVAILFDHPGSECAQEMLQYFRGNSKGNSVLRIDYNYTRRGVLDEQMSTPKLRALSADRL